MTTHTFGKLGPPLEHLGYHVVPVPPGKKGPRCKGWPTPTPVADRLARHECDGVAILTSTAPTIDIDTMDAALALELRDAAFAHLGTTLERIGQPRDCGGGGHTCATLENGQAKAGALY